MKLINVGFGTTVSSRKIVAIVSPESAPIKRVVQDAREAKMLIDATYGRTRAVIIMDSGYYFIGRYAGNGCGHLPDCRRGWFR